MLIGEFASLPEATEPPEYRGIARDAVRLLVTDRDERVHHDRQFRDIVEFIRPGDVVVVNDSVTLPAALRARCVHGGPIMLHVGTSIDATLWITEPRPHVQGEKLVIHPGEKLVLESGGVATLLSPLDKDLPRLWYTLIDIPLPMHAFLAQFGEPIQYSYVTKRLPLTMYQTMFGHVPGSAEMPSAGRPFTPDIVERIRHAGAHIATVTLHCGISSIEKPERPAIEQFTVPHLTAEAVNAAHRDGHRVIAIGTTVVRALESCYRETNVESSQPEIIASSGWTALVIDQAHPARIADALLTGFHQPSATHLDLLRTFTSGDLLELAYDHAAAKGYLCHEFGDVHLII